jgi:hypothetical protein
MLQVRTAATQMCNSYTEADNAIAPGSVHIGAPCLPLNVRVIKIDHTVRSHCVFSCERLDWIQ